MIVKHEIEKDQDCKDFLHHESLTLKAGDCVFADSELKPWEGCHVLTTGGSIELYGGNDGIVGPICKAELDIF